MSELVTVVIPASRVSTLDECLRAVRANSVPVKIIIVRTVATTGILDLAKQHGADVCDFISNTAQHHAREYALKLVETPYVHFLDDDDFIGPAFYEKAISALQEADAVMTSPAVSVGKRVMIFSAKRTKLATNCSAMVYKTDSIKRVFEQLIREYPEIADSYNNLAVIYAGEGNLGRAQDLLERALMNNASSVTTYSNLGDIYAAKAADMYAKAARLAPKNGRLKEKAQIAQDLTIRTAP